MPPPKKRKRKKAKSLGKREGEPNARVYVHKECLGRTEVTDRHFRGICDPHRDVRRTYCTACKDYFPLKQFVWTETEETLSSFRARMKILFPLNHRSQAKLLRWMAAFAAIAVCVIVAWFTSGLLWKIILPAGSFLISLFIFLVVSDAVAGALGIVDPTEEL